MFTARPGFQLVRIVKVLPTAHIGIDRLALFLRGGFPAPVWREEAAVIPCQVYLTYLDCSGPLSSQSSSQVGFETLKLGVEYVGKSVPRAGQKCPRPFWISTTDFSIQPRPFAFHQRGSLKQTCTSSCVSLSLSWEAQLTSASFPPTPGPHNLLALLAWCAQHC